MKKIIPQPGSGLGESSDGKKTDQEVNKSIAVARFMQPRQKVGRRDIQEGSRRNSQNDARRRTRQVSGSGIGENRADRCRERQDDRERDFFRPVVMRAMQEAGSG